MTPSSTDSTQPLTQREHGYLINSDPDGRNPPLVGSVIDKADEPAGRDNLGRDDGNGRESGNAHAHVQGGRLGGWERLWLNICTYIN